MREDEIEKKKEKKKTYAHRHTQADGIANQNG